MPLRFEHGDITKMNVDAVVNTTNTNLWMGRGVDTALRTAAGDDIEIELEAINECMPGEAVVTKGYGLPAKYVIHTVGPHWRGGYSVEAAILRSCYRSCMEKAVEYGCKTIAFPLLSTGNYGYPMDLAIKEAVTTILDFLEKASLTVTLILYTDEAVKAKENFETEWADFLKEHPVPGGDEEDDSWETLGLKELIEQKKKPFGDILRETIALKKLKNATVYHRAWVEKASFHKILNNQVKFPKVTTVAALAVAMRMNLKETEAFLGAAGLALGNTPFDIILRYYIQCGIFDVIVINDKMRQYDQPLLGSGQKI